MDLTTTAKQLTHEEGSRSTVYQDHLGYWTVGIGICVDRRVAGAGLDEEEQAWLLARRLTRIDSTLVAKLPWILNLSEPRRAVLVQMAFQMGIDGLLGFKNTLRAIANENWQLAHDNMLVSKWAQQTPGRAKRMAEQMLTGQWQAKDGFELP